MSALSLTIAGAALLSSVAEGSASGDPDGVANDAVKVFTSLILVADDGAPTVDSSLTPGIISSVGSEVGYSHSDCMEFVKVGGSS